ncbi:MAG: ABC transporter substrate-binding protein, partial [Vicinamibacterales bacterium]
MDHDKWFDDLFSRAAEGKLNRRSLLRRAAALGFGAPAIAALLAACDRSDDSTATAGTGGATTTSTGDGAAPTPTTRSSGAASPVAGSSKRGGGGELRLLWWQAPTILNCHLAAGIKDYDAGRMVLEPLLETSQDGTRFPVLAAEVPTLGNGLAEDGKSVTYKLRQGVKWHDGQEMTAEDVKFTFDWATDPNVAAVTAGYFLQVQSVDVIDTHTVRVNFKDTNPDWFTP